MKAGVPLQDGGFGLADAANGWCHGSDGIYGVLRMMMECCRFVSTGQRYNLYTPLVKFFGIFFAKKPNVPTLAREGLYDLHKRCINSQGGT